MAFLNRTALTAALLLALTAAAAAQDTAPPNPIMDRDTFGDIRLRDMSGPLDNFAIELKNSPEVRLFFILYGGRSGCRGHARWRGQAWKDYLVKRHGIAPGRVVLMYGGYREYFSSDYFLVHPGAAEPEPAPTVDPTEVRFFRGNSRRCRSRRR